MISTASAWRRAFLMLSFALALTAVVIGYALTTRAQSPADTPIYNPDAAGDIWYPADGTNWNLVAYSNQAVVATLESSVLAPIDPTSAVFRIYRAGQPGYQEFTPAISTMNGGHTAIMTATTFPLYNPGEQIRFIVGYSGSSEYSLVTYPITPKWKLYIPSVYMPPLPPDGTNPCTAIPATPGPSYQTTQNVPYRFFRLDLPITSTVTMTAAGYPTQGQMQIRTRITSSCLVTAETVLNYTMVPSQPKLNTYNLPPGTYLVRFNVDAGKPLSEVPFTFSWNYQPGIGPWEPNNTLCTALYVPPGPTWYAYPDDQYDFYYFDSPINGAIISAIFANYNIRGQYQLIRENTSCTDYTILATGDAAMNTITLTVSGLAPGRYALGVLSPLQWGYIGYNQAQPPYSFRVTLNTAQTGGQARATSNPAAPAPVPIPLPSEDGSVTPPPAEVSGYVQKPLPAP